MNGVVYGSFIFIVNLNFLQFLVSKLFIEKDELDD